MLTLSVGFGFAGEASEEKCSAEALGTKDVSDTALKDEVGHIKTSPECGTNTAIEEEIEPTRNSPEIDNNTALKYQLVQTQNTQKCATNAVPEDDVEPTQDSPGTQDDLRIKEKKKSKKSKRKEERRGEKEALVDEVEKEKLEQTQNTPKCVSNTALEEDIKPTQKSSDTEDEPRIKKKKKLKKTERKEERRREREALVDEVEKKKKSDSEIPVGVNEAGGDESRQEQEIGVERKKGNTVGDTEEKSNQTCLTEKDGMKGKQCFIINVQQLISTL